MAAVVGATQFSYDGYDLDPSSRRLVCRYSLGAHRFVEEIRFDNRPERGDVAADDDSAWRSGAVDAAARVVYLLAGVSYYKTAAPPVVHLGELATTERERRFLREFYVEGLAEFAFRNGIELSGLEIVGPPLADRDAIAVGRGAGPDGRAGAPPFARPLVPFGGGIDSIVTAEHVARRHPDASLFVTSRAGDRFAAIERAAAATGIPVVRAERSIDPAVADATHREFLNGHVPVTGILSAVAVMAAVIGGHGAVVMSNERSATTPTIERGGRAVNHQWSKGYAFEAGFRELLASTLDPAPEYFSFLRARSEVWVAREFAGLPRYHDVFRSCNRAFALDPARRLDDWCGTCDKCAFIDLVLAPYLASDVLSGIFGGHEPLCEEAMAARLRGLVGTGADPRPFECVGDEEECRVAAVLAASRPDRDGCEPLQLVASEVRAVSPELAGDGGSGGAGGAARRAERRLLAPQGPHFVPPGLDDELDRAPAAYPGPAGSGALAIRRVHADVPR